MKVLQVARRYSPGGAKSRRQHTRVFYIKKGAVSVRVCKKAFLKMHGVTDGRLERALKAQQAAGGSLHCDQRGRHEPGNKTKSETVDSIKAHIKSFPKYKSHYSRKDNPHREFLNPYLSIQKMYQLYREKCDEENTSAASNWVYRKVFNEHFNLSFGRCVSKLSVFCVHSYTFILSHSQPTQTLSLPSLSSLSLSHTHTHTLTHSLSLSSLSPLSLSFSLSPPLSLSLSHTHTLTLSTVLSQIRVKCATR